MADDDDPDAFAKRRRKRKRSERSKKAGIDPAEGRSTTKPDTESSKVVAFDQNPRFKAGAKLVCRVVGKEPGGYSVLVIQSQTLGFLPTQNSLEVGAEITAHFVCFNNGRMLFSARFSTHRPISAVNPLVEVAKSESEEEL